MSAIRKPKEKNDIHLTNLISYPIVDYVLA